MRRIRKCFRSFANGATGSANANKRRFAGKIMRPAGFEPAARGLEVRWQARGRPASAEVARVDGQIVVAHGRGERANFQRNLDPRMGLQGAA